MFLDDIKKNLEATRQESLREITNLIESKGFDTFAIILSLPNEDDNQVGPFLSLLKGDLNNQIINAMMGTLNTTWFQNLKQIEGEKVALEIMENLLKLIAVSSVEVLDFIEKERKRYG